MGCLSLFMIYVGALHQTLRLRRCPNAVFKKCKPSCAIAVSIEI